MTKHRVTVGLPVYNGEELIEKAVLGVLEQDVDGLQLLVADNCSTDKSLEILQDVAAREPRLEVLTATENRGAAWNYNRLVHESNADYFCWHAHDDVLLPGALRQQVDALDANPDAVLAYPFVHFVNDEGEIYLDYEDDLGVSSDRPHVRLKTIIRNLDYCTSVFGVIRKDELDRSALIASYPGSDRILLYELAVRGPLLLVPEFLAIRRPGNSTLKRTTREVAEWFGPTSVGARFPSAREVEAIMRAIRNADVGSVEATRCAAAVSAAWPRDYARRWRTKRRALQTV